MCTSPFGTIFFHFHADFVKKWDTSGINSSVRPRAPHLEHFGSATDYQLCPQTLDIPVLEVGDFDPEGPDSTGLRSRTLVQT